MVAELGGELEKATWFSKSVALREVCGVARALRLAVEAVMEGSVALERRRRGRRQLLLDRDESRLELRRWESEVGEPMSSSESNAEARYGLWWKIVGIKIDRFWMLSSIWKEAGEFRGRNSR